ncbi:protein lsm12 homolog [Plakobranchus ocellatus]|uniref:Protein lsm12 homolog n=1 Tax=Plakobranchus ocellatus TaxID=259542 RepID=A0AAV4ADK1_9GAST|nr:protein lsm12 homolog [Plakobranchus ocellatus]
MNSTENDILTIGSVIKIVDVHKVTYKGTVRSFDLSSKILSIETPSPSVAQLSDIYFFNLDYVADIVTLEEKQGSPDPVPYVNVSKIAKRLSEQEKDRQKQMTYIGVGVSPEGQRLMNTISKT